MKDSCDGDVIYFELNDEFFEQWDRAERAMSAVTADGVHLVDLTHLGIQIDPSQAS